MFPRSGLQLCCLVALLLRCYANDASVTCNDMEAPLGRTATLNCSIALKGNCRSIEFFWRSDDNGCNCRNGTSHNKTKCGCGWNARSYVYLKIFNVTKDGLYMVRVQTNCGLRESTGFVNATSGFTTITSATNGRASQGRSNSTPKSAVGLGLLLALVGVGLLVLLIMALRRRLGRRITDRPEPPPENLLP